MKPVTSSHPVSASACLLLAACTLTRFSIAQTDVFHGFGIVSPRVVRPAEVNDAWSAVALSRDGELAAFRHAARDVVRLDEIGALQCRTCALGSVGVADEVSISVSPRRIAWITPDRVLEIRSYPHFELLGSTKDIVSEDDTRVRDFEISPDGKKVAVAFADVLSLYCEDADGQWKRIAVWSRWARMSTITWSSDSMCLAESLWQGNRSLRTAHVRSGVRDVRLSGFPERDVTHDVQVSGLPDSQGNSTNLCPHVYDADFSADGSFLVAGGRILCDGKTIGFVGRWNTETGELVSYVTLPGALISLVRLSQNGGTMFVNYFNEEGRRDDIIELRTSDYGVQNIFRIPEPPIELAISAEPRRLVCLSRQGRIYVWSVDVRWP